MKNKSQCPLCGGKIKEGTTTFTVDYGFGLVVVRNVPAGVCSQCGETWVDDSFAERPENIVQEAKAGRQQFEVVDIAA